MDSNFLEEYERCEFEAFTRYGNVSKRIGDLASPIFHITGPCSSIWSQIAFSGTVIFPLHPLPQSVFEKGWKISIDEFPSLIQFVKETKKIQFVLTAPPTQYEEFDYLEPILRELTPPLYTQIGGDDKRLQTINLQCTDEINSLIPLSPEWKVLSLSVGGQHVIQDYIKSYAFFRYMGFNDIADTFIDNFLANPKFSTEYLTIAYDLLADPLVDPFKANPSYCIEKIRNAIEMGITIPKNPSFPEIGSFLIKKCTHYPDSLEACKILIDRYEENDLYRVYNALNRAIVDRNDTSIIERKDAIDEILDNVWTDTTVKENATTIRYGIDITCGTVGYCLGGTSLGLLASVGLHVVDSGNYIDQFSELISRRIASPYMATIYDFKKEYRKEN
jgi:hypothetical protein